jgi:hypothetical protein
VLENLIWGRVDFRREAAEMTKELRKLNKETFVTCTSVWYCLGNEVEMGECKDKLGIYGSGRKTLRKNTNCLSKKHMGKYIN